MPEKVKEDLLNVIPEDAQSFLGDSDNDVSPEPSLGESLCIAKDVSLKAMTPYDNIGDVFSADEASYYVKRLSCSRKLWMTVLHNSATPQNGPVGIEAVRSFYLYHVNVRKWRTIGYHFIISPDGKIYAGRKIEITGAHAGRKGNPGSVGVCLIGNLEKNDRPTLQQKIALAKLHVALHERFYGPASLMIRFHREFMSTACPGKITQQEVMGWVYQYGLNQNSDQTPDQGIAIFKDGAYLCDALVVNNRAFAPLRLLFSPPWQILYIGRSASVKYGAEPRSYPFKDGTRENPAVWINDEFVCYGLLKNWKLWVPVREVAEKAEYKVSYDAIKKIVSITTK